MWLTGIALGIVVVVGGYLFHSNLQDNLRDVKDNASRTAIDESRDAVRKAFDEEHVKKLVEDIAKEKIGAVTDQMVADKVNAIADKMIQERLASKYNLLRRTSFSSVASLSASPEFISDTGQATMNS